MSGTAEDFAAASAKDAVDESMLNDNEVDFVWVLRGFLTHYFPTNHGWKSEQDIVLAVLFSPNLCLTCFGSATSSPTS
jgi:Argonaute siRNA chaperone (ARC) complex subunit Arb1